MIPSLRAGALLTALVALASIAPAQQLPTLPPPDKQPAAKPDDPAAKQPDVKPEPGVQVLDKGPIHEAFAQPGADTRGKGLTAPKAPPPPVPELPPETKPDGATWVPGYWLWDGDRNDFIWVSG